MAKAFPDEETAMILPKMCDGGNVPPDERKNRPALRK